MLLIPAPTVTCYSDRYSLSGKLITIRKIHGCIPKSIIIISSLWQMFHTDLLDSCPAPSLVPHRLKIPSRPTHWEILAAIQCVMCLAMFEETCRHDRGCSKCNRGQPDVFERVSIVPPSPDCRGLYHGWCDPQQLNDQCRICQQSRHKRCRLRKWNTGLDCVSCDVQGELMGELTVENVVVDCVSDRTSDDTDRKGQSHTSSDEIVRTD